MMSVPVWPSVAMSSARRPGAPGAAHQTNKGKQVNKIMLGAIALFALGACSQDAPDAAPEQAAPEQAAAAPAAPVSGIDLSPLFALIGLQVLKMLILPLLP